MVDTRVMGHLWLLAALALVGCHSTEAADVGYRLAQYNFPDAGVSCWLYKADMEAVGSLSCVRVAP